MSPQEAIAMARNLEGLVEEARNLKVGEEMDAPVIKFKIKNKSYEWRDGKVKRIR